MRRSVFPSSKVLIYVILYVLIARFGAWSKLLKLSSCAFPIRQLSLFWGLLMFMLPIVPGSNGCDMLKDTRWPCLHTSNLQKQAQMVIAVSPQVHRSWPEVTIEFFEIFWHILLKPFEACFSFFFTAVEWCNNLQSLQEQQSICSVEWSLDSTALPTDFILELLGAALFHRHGPLVDHWWTTVSSPGRSGFSGGHCCWSRIGLGSEACGMHRTRQAVRCCEIDLWL